ncbi:MAG: LacI family DNA-binding transcriptional regulator [Spirochaetia bacterium]|jgi:DNA-binding LacI/PurR family transcriptional regulator
MPKLRVISELANVSISTVSRVLTNKGNVNQETREKVLNALAELTGKTGPDKVTGLSLTVGLLVPEKGEFINDDPMTSIDIVSMKREIEALGNRVVMFRYAENSDSPEGAPSADVGKIDVAIINDPSADDRIIPVLERRGTPFIVTNGRFDRDCNYVDYDNYDGALQAVRHLVQLGHREIGAITGPINRMVSINRLSAYRDALREAGISPDDAKVVQGAFSLNGGYNACQKLIAEYPRVSAIFAFNDLSAIGAVRALKEAGLGVPADVSVVGFDDMEIARYSDPQLTTVSRFKFDISALLARAADDLGRNKDIMHIRISLRTRLVIRQSTQAFLGS